MEETKHILHANADILKKAQTIFGKDVGGDEMVVEAYLVWAYPDSGVAAFEILAMQQAQEAAESYSVGDIEMELPVDSTHIALRLFNGKLISFSSSEWGALTLIGHDSISHVF